MVERETVLRIIRSICFAAVLGFTILWLFAQILPPTSLITNPLLEKPEYVGWIAAVLFFFVIVLFPLPKWGDNVLVIIRSVLITTLASYLVFAGLRQLHPEAAVIMLLALPFLLGLILSSWKISK